MSEQNKDAERAAFEAYMLGREHPVFGWIDGHWFSHGDDPATYANDYVQGCWVMWQACSLPVGVPDGYALVPVEPTPEMISAGWKVGLMGMDREGPQAVYRAMLNGGEA